MSPGSTRELVEATRVAVDFVLSGDVASFDTAAFATSLRDFFGCYPPTCTLQLDVFSASVLARVVLIDTGGTVGAAAAQLNSTSAPALSEALGVTVEAAPSVTVETVRVSRILSAPSPPPPSQLPLIEDSSSSVMTDQPRNATGGREPIIPEPIIVGTGGVLLLLILVSGLCVACRHRRQQRNKIADVYVTPPMLEGSEPRVTPLSKRGGPPEEDRNRSDVGSPPPLAAAEDESQLAAAKPDADEAGPSEAELARSPQWRHRQLSQAGLTRTRTRTRTRALTLTLTLTLTLSPSLTLTRRR